MKYNVVISVNQTDAGSVFVARYPKLEGVSGTGDTQFEALKDLQENAEAHIAFMKMDGEEPPEFDVETPVNAHKAFQVRLPYDLYQDLQQRSESSKISMNQIILLALQRDLMHFDYLDHFKQTIKPKAAEVAAIASIIDKELLEWGHRVSLQTNRLTVSPSVRDLALKLQSQWGYYDNEKH